MESGGFTSFADDVDVKHGFLRKVYATLTLQLAVTIGIVCCILFPEGAKEYIQGPNGEWLFWTSFCVLIVMSIVLACATELRRRAPINIICLMVYTIAEGVLLGTVCSYYETNEVLLAFGITGILVLCLTIFAFQTRIDFTAAIGVALSLCLTLIMFGVFAAIFYNDVVFAVYGGLGAGLMCLYIVIDTQLMIGGKHKYELDPEEYIFAALNLYLDIINLFLYLLMIIKSSG